MSDCLLTTQGHTTLVLLCWLEWADSGVTSTKQTGFYVIHCGGRGVCVCVFMGIQLPVMGLLREECQCQSSFQVMLFRSLIALDFRPFSTHLCWPSQLAGNHPSTGAVRGAWHLLWLGQENMLLVCVPLILFLAYRSPGYRAVGFGEIWRTQLQCQPHSKMSLSGTLFTGPSVNYRNLNSLLS